MAKLCDFSTEKFMGF